MVSDERKKCAAYEEELGVCRAQREALKGALKVVEAENTALRGGASFELGTLAPTVDSDAARETSANGTGSDEEGDSRTPPYSRSPSSSMHAMKSPPTSPSNHRQGTSRGADSEGHDQTARGDSMRTGGSLDLNES